MSPRLRRRKPEPAEQTPPVPVPRPPPPLPTTPRPRPEARRGRRRARGDRRRRPSGSAAVPSPTPPRSCCCAPPTRARRCSPAAGIAVAAALAGRPGREVGLVLATVLVGQAVLGWHNDLVDRAPRRAAAAERQADRRRLPRPRHRLVRAGLRRAAAGPARGLQRRHRRLLLPRLGRHRPARQRRPAPRAGSRG